MNAYAIEPESEDGDKYTAVSMMFLNTPEHNFDTLFDLIEDWLPPCSDEECTCGLVSMGGCSGTEEQCWKHLGIHESIAEVKTSDLKTVLALFNVAENLDLTEEEIGAIERLRKEAYWWDQTWED